MSQYSVQNPSERRAGAFGALIAALAMAAAPFTPALAAKDRDALAPICTKDGIIYAPLLFDAESSGDETPRPPPPFKAACHGPCALPRHAILKRGPLARILMLGGL